MSNFLAIATVTAALINILQENANYDVPDHLIDYATLPPGQASDNVQDARINIYLYQVTSNTAWRNADLPTRRSDGTVMQRPQIALDLHYIISFYGDEKELVPQRLLGSVVRTLHTQPILSREKINNIVNPQKNGSSQTSYLAQSTLANQLELVRFSPLYLSLDDLSKIWSVLFQVQYALTVAYVGSVVLIESDDMLRSALPVRASSTQAIPFNQPVIEQVFAQTASPSFNEDNAPIILGSILRIRGKKLLGTNGTLIRIGDKEVTPAAKNVTNTQITLPLTVNPQESDLPVNDLRAGVQKMQIMQPRLLGNPPTLHRGVESNVAAFVLRPTIDVPGKTPFTFPHNADGTVDGSIDITISGPPVGKAQRVILLLNEFRATTQNAAPEQAYSFEASPRVNDPATTVAFPIKAVQPGTYLVRISVDGAESLLTVDASGQYAEPQVTIQ